MKSRLIFCVIAVFALESCAVELPSLVVKPSHSAFKIKTLRLPARYLEKQTAVRLARIQARRFAVEPAVILGVMTQESSFNIHAVSWVGAQGLMQLMPETIHHIRRHSSVQISSPFNPVDNMAAGTWYLRSLYDQFRTYPESQRWAFALASYNGGLNRVMRAIQRSAWKQKKPRQNVTWNDIREYMPSQTQHYVPAVLQYVRYYRQNLARSGFERT